MLADLLTRILELKPAYIRAHSQTITRLIQQNAVRKRYKSKCGNEPSPKNTIVIYGIPVIEYPTAGFHELIFVDRYFRWLGTLSLDEQRTRFPEGPEL